MLFDPPTAPATTAPSRGLLIAAAALTIVVGFGLGFVLSGARSTGDRSLAVGPPSTTTSASAPTTSTPSSTVTPTTQPPTTVALPSTTTIVTTTLAPTTVPITIAPTVPTVPRTPPPTQAPPTTFAPPKVVVTYPADAQGRLVIPRTGSATLTITNQGGLASQWLVTGSGFSTSGGQSQGTIGPGQSQFIFVFAPPGDLPKGGSTGIISVLGATNSSIPFVIPAA